MPKHPALALERLLADLAAAGRMQQDRPTAAERIESLLGADLAGVLRTALSEPTPAGGLAPRRAA